MLDQARRRLGIAADGRIAGAENARLLAADGLARGAEKIHVIEIDAGDDGDVGLVDVGGVEPPAEADLEDDGVERLRGEDLPRRQRAELEIGQRHVAARRFDPREALAQRGVVDRPPVDADALVVIDQMRRGVEADAIAGAAQDALEHGAGRALAVGAADEDDRAGLALAQAAADFAHPVEAQRDRLGVLALDVGEPVGEVGGL